MTLLMRALVLGYGSALMAGLWIDAAGLGLWLAVLVAWIGGGLFSLALAWIGAMLWPEVSAAGEADALGDEFGRWDADLAGERLAAWQNEATRNNHPRPLDRAG